jgi:putative DNA primase/helicase
MFSPEEFDNLSPEELDDYINHLEYSAYEEEHYMTYYPSYGDRRPYVPGPQPLPKLGSKLIAKTIIAPLNLIDPANVNFKSQEGTVEFFSTTTLESLVNKHLPPREFVLAPIIPERGLAMLFASRGVGKTHVGLGIAYAVASGGSFLRWNAPKPRRVLYIDGEMPEVLLQERSKALKNSSKKQLPNNNYFTFLSMDCQDLGSTINLADPLHQTIIDQILNGFEFVVIDNISTLVSGGRENDAASWDKMQAWLLQLRRRGITVLLIHHTGRGENARGTSKREDVLDTVLLLKRPIDYKMAEGARFEVHLTKARGISGTDAEPFEAHLQTTEAGNLWHLQMLGNDDVSEKVIAMSKEGLSVREIGSALNLGKSKVHRLQAELRELGRL